MASRPVDENEYLDFVEQQRGHCVLKHSVKGDMFFLRDVLTIYAKNTKFEQRYYVLDAGGGDITITRRQQCGLIPISGKSEFQKALASCYEAVATGLTSES